VWCSPTTQVGGQLAGQASKQASKHLLVAVGGRTEEGDELSSLTAEPHPSHTPHTPHTHPAPCHATVPVSAALCYRVSSWPLTQGYPPGGQDTLAETYSWTQITMGTDHACGLTTDGRGGQAVVVRGTSRQGGQGKSCAAKQGVVLHQLCIPV